MECVNWEGRSPKGIKKIIKRFLGKIRGETNIDDLIHQGMEVGKNFWVGDACAFDTSFCWLIKIGNNVTLSNRVQLITHDSSLHDFVHKTKLGRIVIDDFAFVGARSLILPGVHIGEGAIVAAGSLVTKDIPAGEVWGGYPTVKMMDRSELEERFNDNKYKVFGFEYLHNMGDPIVRKEIIKELETNGRCFIV